MSFIGKKENHSGMTRRIVAFIADCILSIVVVFILAIVLILFISIVGSFSDLLAHIMVIIMAITAIAFALFLVIPFIFHIFMLVKFGGTPGQLLFSMRVKDKDTLEKITLMQAINRTVTFGVLYFIIYCVLLDISGIFLILPILILIYAVCDKYKQALHDKFARTVVIDYKPS